MRLKTLLAVGSAVCGLAWSSHAFAGGVYSAGGDIGSGGPSLSYTIHTDGKLGTLTDADILYVFFDDPDGHEGYGGINVPDDGSLQATKIGLFFNFDVGTTITAGGTFEGFENGPSACYGSSCGGPVGEYLSDYGFTKFTPESGIVEIAVAPEPASWALVVFGVGLAGASLRASRTPRRLTST